MKILTWIFMLVLLILSFNLSCQTSILGQYEHQTGATERTGEIINIRSDYTVELYDKNYNKALKIAEGSWRINGDTLHALISKHSRVYKIVSANLLSSFDKPSKDTLVNGMTGFIAFTPTFWVKTVSYHPNGMIESRRHVCSISSSQPDTTRDGTWIFYYKTGQLRATGLYENGRKKGKWIYYTTEGEIINEKSE